MSVSKQITTIKYILCFLTLALFFSLTPLATAGSSLWGPWDKDRVYENTIIQSQPQHNRQTVFDKLTTFPTQLLITFFQKVISPVDGPTCDFYPTCSAYARQALKKHGLFIGLTMANERANRNHSPEGYELIFRYGRYYIYDPVENNDFWFHKGRDTAP
jgi:putative membrane protein insertion efficiency factor